MEQDLLLVTVMRAGDAAALAEIEASSDDILVRLPVEAVAEIPGERGVKLLVRMFVRATHGFPFDDTGQAEQCVASVTRALQERSAADRGVALRLLEEQRSTMLFGEIDPVVLWALGQPLEPEIVPRLMPYSVIEACDLDLSSEAHRYAEVVQRMRADPRRFVFPLALLRDEESLPAMLDALAETVRPDRSPSFPPVATFDPLFAIDRIGSPAAADRLFEISGTSEWAARQCLLELAKLDRPRISRASPPFARAIPVATASSTGAPSWSCSDAGTEREAASRRVAQPRRASGR